MGPEVLDDWEPTGPPVKYEILYFILYILHFIFYLPNKFSVMTVLAEDSRLLNSFLRGFVWHSWSEKGFIKDLPRG